MNTDEDLFLCPVSGNLFLYVHEWGEPVDRQIDHEVYHLPDPCGNGPRPRFPISGNGPSPKIITGSRKILVRAAAHQGDHGDFHLSDRLKDLFKGQVKSNDDGKSKNDIG